MTRSKLWQMLVPLAVLVIFSSCAPEQPIAVLDTPANLILNRGHIAPLAFGGPMGLSWDDVEDRQTFSVLVFRNADSVDPNAAVDRIDGIDVLYLNVNTAFGSDLSDGPFWFRVQALAGEDFSHLSEPMGPFWYAMHSDVLAFNAPGSYDIFSNPAIPVVVIDTRRIHEREAQGHIAGDVHGLWPNQGAVAEDGATHAGFQDIVLTEWQDFIATRLTPQQRANLDPLLGYRDIHIFVY